jgi:isopenicillin N synthase-like dioxygenase
VSVATVDWRASDADARLVASLRDTGFAVLRGTGLPLALLRSLYGQWSVFFSGPEPAAWPARPLRELDPSRYADSENQVGYFPPEVSETAVGQQLRDLKAFFHAVPGAPMPAALRPATERWMRLALQLAAEVLAALQRAAPPEVSSAFSRPLPSALSATHSMLRVLWYPPLTGTEPAGAVRAAAHEDINLVTLLPIASEPGLEVLLRSGEWHLVAGAPGDLVINAGDMLQEASGGYFRSTTHRVVNPRGEEAARPRLSMPYFMAPDLDMRLSPQRTAGDFLNERLRAIGVNPNIGDS